MPTKNNETTMVDTIIGDKIKQQRLAMGKSRKQLGDKIGVSLQQLAKYEDATNRITLGRLVLIAKAQKKPISYYFDDIDEHDTTPSQHERMAMEISRNFMKIKDFDSQTAVNQLVKTLSGVK